MEQLTNPPPFGSGASRFDMSTYGGRALHFLNVLGDPTTLWTSAAELEAHRDLLRRHAKGEKTGATDAELWRADKVVTATTRGETGEMVPAPFRFSFFACAAPVCFRVAVRGAPAASAAAATIALGLLFRFISAICSFTLRRRCGRGRRERRRTWRQPWPRP